MKAITKTSYGGPEILQLEEVEKPSVGDNQVLVKVYANSANPADWHTLRGDPFFARFATGLLKPKDKILGADFSGVVEETGKNVKHFQPGDRVFGEYLKGGAFAEYLSINEEHCGKMPANSGFEEMASVPIAGLTAIQGVVTHGKLKAGESVLINGASGGVGHFAIQIAKAYGGVVTGVCSSRNAGFVRELGADHVLAYDKTNIHEHHGKYDLVIDTHGNLFHADFKRMGHRGVLIGFTTMGHMIRLLLRSLFSQFPLTQFTAQAKRQDLQTLASLIENGSLRVNVEKTYSYADIPQAITYIEKMHTRGKVAMVWDH